MTSPEGRSFKSREILQLDFRLLSPAYLRQGLHRLGPDPTDQNIIRGVLVRMRLISTPTQTKRL